MKKRNETIKSFILENNQVDLLYSSKRRLVFEITNNEDDKTTLVYLKTKFIRKIGKLIYERIMLIDRGDAKIEIIKGNIPIQHYVKDTKRRTRRGIIAITMTKSGEIYIALYIKNKFLQRVTVSKNLLIL